MSFNPCYHKKSHFIYIKDFSHKKPANYEIIYIPKEDPPTNEAPEPVAKDVSKKIPKLLKDPATIPEYYPPQDPPPKRKLNTNAQGFDIPLNNPTVSPSFPFVPPPLFPVTNSFNIAPNIYGASNFSMPPNVFLQNNLNQMFYPNNGWQNNGYY